MITLDRELLFQGCVALEERRRNNGEWPNGQVVPECIWLIAERCGWGRDDPALVADVETLIRSLATNAIAELCGLPPR